MPSRCWRFVLDNNLILAICTMIVVFSFMRPIMLLLVEEQCKDQLSLWWFGHFIHLRTWGYWKSGKMILAIASNAHSWGDVYSGSYLNEDTEREQKGETIVLNRIKMCGWPGSFIIRDKVWLVHKCFSVFQCSFGFEKCFLVRKLYQEIWGHMLTSKIGTHEVCWTIWADRSDLLCKLVKTNLSNCKLDFTIA